MLELVSESFNRTGLLHDLTAALKKIGVDVIKLNMEDDEEQVTRLALRLDVPGNLTPDQVISALSGVRNVFGVERKKL